MLKEHHTASVVMDCGRRLLQEVYNAQLKSSQHTSEAVGIINSGDLFNDLSSFE